jgi:hypothetical protein
VSRAADRGLGGPVPALTGGPFRPGPADPPDLVLSGPPDGIIGLLGGLFGAEAAEHGVTILGDARDLDRLRQPDWLSGPVES